MRLIDADALLDSLHESLGNAKKWEVKSSFAKDDEARTRAEATIASFTECCLRIKAQPTIDAVEVKHGEWVSVKDRLPEDGQEVLVYAVGKADGFIGNSVTTISERFIFRLFPWSDGVEEWRSPWEYFDSNYEITHWMPLPKQPKGEEE